jgi:hypothetical protein
MNCWRIGSNWDNDNLLEIFKKNRIAFAGAKVKDQLAQVRRGDLVAITNGQPIRAVGKVAGVIDLSSVAGGYADEYDHVKAISFETLYFADDFKSVDFGEYGGQGKEFHQALQGYPKHIQTVYQKITQILMDNQYSEMLLKAKNVVLTGAPGTGKTYLARQMAEKLILTPEQEGHIEETAFEDYRSFAFDPAEVERVDRAWHYWKSRILADDFNLDDFANVLGNIADPQVSEYGGYLMNFLERTSSKIYGSSKPGNADNYGIKMNTDHSYGFYDSDDKFNREEAERRFGTEIRPWLQNLLSAGFDQQIVLAGNPPALIRSRQLIRKILVLEHPAELLCTYQDKTIDNAYKYFVRGGDTDYFGQSRALLSALFSRFKLPRTKENQFRIQQFVWHFFSQKGGGNLGVTHGQLKQEYINDYTGFVQFHPSYDYTDFFDGLRPFRKEGQSEIGFELKNGSFKAFCLRAKRSMEEDKSPKRFVFIIDEINRAEIAKVFGELFFAIDPGYRGTAGMVKTQYGNIQTTKTCFTDADDDWFYVPENVYIIGTMNDIDRSVESFDFAMRRRFAWMEISAEERKSMWDGKIDAWKEDAGKKMTALNKAIENVSGLSSAYHIGPAYFLRLSESQGDFQQLWYYHIGVILKEYLRGSPNADETLSSLKTVYDYPLAAV